MAARRPPRIQSPRDADNHPPHSKEDFDLLDAFCADVSFDEISFESWTNHHNSLDLEITVFISPSDQQKKIEVVAQWTRTIYSPQGTKTRPERVKMSKSLTLVGPFTKKQVIVLKGLGDQKGSISGDLKVIICIK